MSVGFRCSVFPRFVQTPVSANRLYNILHQCQKDVLATLPHAIWPRWSFRTTKYGELSTALATPMSHYRSWNLTVTCPSCREKKEVRIERHISDGRGGEAVSKFLTRLRCGTCRRMPDTIKLHGETPPKVEIVLLGPGAY